MAKNKEAGSGISKKVMVCISLFLGIASMLPIVKMAFNSIVKKLIRNFTKQLMMRQKKRTTPKMMPALRLWI